MTSIASMLILAIVMALGFLVYWIPTIIARARRHENTNAIALLNFFLGWTFIGWVAALIWSATSNVTPLPLPVYPQQVYLPPVYPSPVLLPTEKTQ